MGFFRCRRCSHNQNRWPRARKPGNMDTLSLHPRSTPQHPPTKAPMTTDNIITLDTPITRGEQLITTIALRKPMAGELRGINLLALLQMDVSAAIAVLPRISTPALTTQDVERMDPADLMQLTSTVTSFLLPKSASTAYPNGSNPPAPTLQ